MDDRIHILYNNLLRFGPMANQEIASLMDLSPATVTHLIQPLEFSGMLQERPSHDYPPDHMPQLGGGQHKSRRKTTFRPNPAFASVLVLECSGVMLHVRLVRFDLSVDPAQSRLIELDEPERVISACQELISQVQSHEAHPVVAIGLVMPWHPVDHRFAGAFPEQLAKTISSSCGLPVRCLADAQALALSEAFCGMGRKFRDFLVVYIHEAISLGAILGAELHEPGIAGKSAAAPGLSILEPGGPRLPGMVPGSASACLSRAAIDRDLSQLGLAEDHHQTYLILQRELRRAVAPSGTAPDTPDLRPLVTTLARRCGLLLVNLAAAYAPDRIFLYSPLNELGPVFTDSLQANILDLVPRESRDYFQKLVVLSGDWISAMTSGAAKATFDTWLSTLPRTGGTLEVS